MHVLTGLAHIFDLVQKQARSRPGNSRGDKECSGGEVHRKFGRLA